MNDLVEQKLKKLHYFPPQFHVQPPDTMLAVHPLLADIPDKKFKSQVSITLPCVQQITFLKPAALEQWRIYFISLYCCALMLQYGLQNVLMDALCCIFGCMVFP